MNIQQERKEYLLVKSFNIVFEAIIDELLGEKNIPAGLKEQADGKTHRPFVQLPEPDYNKKSWKQFITSATAKTTSHFPEEPSGLMDYSSPV